MRREDDVGGNGWSAEEDKIFHNEVFEHA